MTEQWKPACEIETLQLRAQMLASIRSFFLQRSVLEVETPLLCHATGTDPQLDFFSSYYHCSPENREMFLQTSPEFAMKRLIAAGSGSIYQVCKAFRNSEFGRLHNPEFSILEWYRMDFSLEQLMDEVAELIMTVIPGHCLPDSVKKMSYVSLFKQLTDLDPLVFCRERYTQYAVENGIPDAATLCADDHSMWLDFIFSYKAQPALADFAVCMVYGYPAIQSSLARLNPDNPRCADRFEVFVNGVEIGNGFFELSDVYEQENRFDQENNSRIKRDQLPVQKDQLFLDAIRSGLPDCSGIALGLDRLLMIATNKNSLNDVLAFPFDRA